MIARLARRAGAAAWCIASLLCLAGVPDTAHAQRRDDPALPELRLDGLFGRDAIVQLAAGLAVPVSNYVRVVGIAGFGWRDGAGDDWQSVRGELVARFGFDPLREHRWAPYGAAGAAVLWDQVEDTRGRLVAVLGVEGPRGRNGWAPAFELGLGGGVRASVVLRRARAGRR